MMDRDEIENWQQAVGTITILEMAAILAKAWWLIVCVTAIGQTLFNLLHCGPGAEPKGQSDS